MPIHLVGNNEVIIYGLGKNFTKSLEYLKLRFRIVACSDTDISKAIIASRYGYEYVPPTKISTLKYDYILITSIYEAKIIDFLINECNVSRNRILCRNEWQSMDFLTSFGEKNPNKVFYLMSKPIRRYNGIVSVLYMFVCQMSCLDMHKYIPVIDLQSYPNQYLEDDEVGVVNAWEKFFEPISSYSVDEVKQSKNVVLGYDDPGYLSDFFFRYDIRKLSDLYKEYIHFKPSLWEYIKQRREEVLGNKKNILGVLYRGTDMVSLKLPYHMIQPSIEEICVNIDNGIKEWKCDYIYVSTEDTRALEILSSRYPEKIIYMNQLRYDNLGNKWIAEVKNSRENDTYWRGAEYIATIWLLSQCDYLISGVVAGSIGALIMNDGKYKETRLIDKGCYLPM